MATIEFLPATFEDAEQVFKNLREEDMFEFVTLGDRETVLTVLLRESLEAWVGYVNKVPAVVFGLRRDTLMSYGVLWLATTPLIETVKRASLRLAYGYVQAKLAQEGVLEGWVLERNVRSQRWLKWMGFELSPAFHLEPVGMVHHFIKRL